jgi:hypothetical protein
MKLWEKYLKYIQECDEASEYNELPNGSEPEPVEKASKTIEDELVEEDKKWIQKAIKRPGSLHRALGVPQDEKIPASKLKVKPGDTTKMKRKKILAKTLSKMQHK